MAIKATMFVMLSATVFCLVGSADRWGLIGGFAVSDCDDSSTRPPPPPVQQRSSKLNVVLSICVSVLVTYAVSKLLEQDSVLLVQVALDGDTKKIEQDLGEIVTQSRTERGLHMLLSSTVSCIYRYPGSCFAAYSRVEKTGKYIGAGWEKCFDEAYSELRKKVNPFVCANDSGDKELATQNTYLVVSILVAASGRHKLPTINSYSDLDRVLCYLTSIYSRDIKAVKMMWATRHSIEDFPKLRRLRS